MNPRRSESGQAIVITTFALVALLGMSALVLDVGAWFHTKRKLQATADAAALAGAQKLPMDPTGAKAMAQSYADQNGGNVAGGDIVVTSTNGPDDTITVKAAKTDPGIFSRVLGEKFISTDIKAHAKALVGPPAKARYVAPMVVSCNHDLIKNCDGNGSPKFKVSTTMDFDKMGAPGAFGMLNLNGGNGTVGASEEGEWILHGFDKYLPLGNYRSDPGAKFSSSNVSGALNARIGTVLLFPVFKTLTGNGQNAEYDIIGWIGFHLEKVTKVTGNNTTLTGYFTEYIAQGILAGSGGSGGSSGAPGSFGVTSIQLIE